MEKTIYLAGGCFWGMQKFFDQFYGVIKTKVGYANGPSAHPSYKDVCSDSGHAETLKIVYDDTCITLTELLDNYFMAVDPLSVNRQGEDTGIQYRSGIYYINEDQKEEIDRRVKQEADKYNVPLAVEVKPLENFYKAEEYHQKYLEKNPGGYCHISKQLIPT